MTIANPGWRATAAYQALSTAIGRRFRTRRMIEFCDTLGVTPATRVLDVGGGLDNWLLLPLERRPRVMILHFDPIPLPRPWPDGIEYIRGSALAIPFARRSFDIVFSNSVIEHVGDLNAQRLFAAEVKRLGVSYWVQTPNYYFPIEPHFLGLGVQFLPRPLAVSYIQWASAWGWFNRASRDEIRAALSEIRLLSPSELQALFPEGRIHRERVLGFTKSIVAVGLWR